MCHAALRALLTEAVDSHPDVADPGRPSTGNPLSGKEVRSAPLPLRRSRPAPPPSRHHHLVTIPDDYDLAAGPTVSVAAQRM